MTYYHFPSMTDERLIEFIEKYQSPEARYELAVRKIERYAGKLEPKAINNLKKERKDDN